MILYSIIISLLIILTGISDRKNLDIIYFIKYVIVCLASSGTESSIIYKYYLIKLTKLFQIFK